MVAENGLGAVDTVEADGSIHEIIALSTLNSTSKKIIKS